MSFFINLVTPYCLYYKSEFLPNFSTDEEDHKRQKSYYVVQGCHCIRNLHYGCHSFILHAKHIVYYKGTLITITVQTVDLDKTQYFSVQYRLLICSKGAGHFNVLFFFRITQKELKQNQMVLFRTSTTRHIPDILFTDRSYFCRWTMCSY